MYNEMSGLKNEQNSCPPLLRQYYFVFSGIIIYISHLSRTRVANDQINTLLNINSQLHTKIINY